MATEEKHLATRAILKNQAKEYLQIKKDITESQEYLKDLKEEIIELMKFLELKEFNDGCSIHWVIPKTFDELKFCAENPDLHKQFCRTISYEEFNKKEFKKLHPELHDKYLKEMTARLTIK